MGKADAVTLPASGLRHRRLGTRRVRLNWSRHKCVPRRQTATAIVLKHLHWESRGRGHPCWISPELSLSHLLPRQCFSCSQLPSALSHDLLPPLPLVRLSHSRS